ncbi:MAG: DUF523 domain-containing protein [Desulfovibrio sp.]|nr:DUF523 domain-containing protein [Desulfovibrio sp.]
MTRPKRCHYVVSACLAGLACRYDGGSNACGAVVALVRAGLAVPACPATLGELPVPREPCEQRDGRVVSRDGIDRTEAFLRGSRKALDVALAHGCRAAILKSRSPSCGCGRIYDGTFTRTLIPGMGTWARLLREAGLELYTEENLPPLEMTNAPKP